MCARLNYRRTSRVLRVGLMDLIGFRPSWVPFRDCGVRGEIVEPRNEFQHFEGELFRIHRVEMETLDVSFSAPRRPPVLILGSLSS